MAKWIRRLTTDQEIAGSSPGRVDRFTQDSVLRTRSAHSVPHV